MTRFNLYAAAATILAASVFTASCKKDAQQANRPVSATQIVPANGATLSGILGTGKTIRDTIHLTGGTYLLSGLVYIDTLDVIQIDAGSVIKGIPGTPGVNPGGGLVVSRGGKIEAVGTATSPIVFTTNSASPAAGQTAGIIILGRATTNNGDTSKVEGIGGIPPLTPYYGGSVDTDNSGKLKYVRIEYAGFELATDNEINGLTLAGVGSGTEIDFVEVYKAADDGIEFFGGTVDAKHLVVVNPLDDGLDFDNGYRGRIQYALVVEDSTRADKSASNGIESDNNKFGQPLLPVTKPLIANLTIIGLPNQALATKTTFAPSGTGKYGVAAQWRRSSRFEVYNSVFLGFNNGILLDNTVPAGGTAADQTTQQRYSDGTSIIKNNMVHAFNLAFTSSPAYAGTKPYPDGVDNNTSYVAPDPNASLKLVNPFNRGIAGFYMPRTGTPAIASPALTGGLTTGLPAGLTGTTYRGAFDGTNNWASGWTVFAY
ncbi:hypothetical protein SAMN05660461_4873 [Chitinophaga ginsengisegetis]|uniref:DUF5689 domain-containing protein n=1 Tax=Chitinophaga ginsengisegetis TaxID=393003 RepID=A0A1T5P8K9_9BACT|nr:hypothetical protein [Chitinophaga ginsengisegetis]SKD08996.1 hypothetical protein SAMN05660461_4873 [Chitinophaga ginsengisegetis]